MATQASSREEVFVEEEPGREPIESLLQRIRDGDESARDELLDRYIPIFRRWAHGRLPNHARDISETDDLVQLSLIRALRSLERFQGTTEGAFISYLRTTLMNLVRDEIARSKRRPRREDLSEYLPTDMTSPLQHVINRETLEVYESSLNEFPEQTRQAVFLRFEFGMSYPEIAGIVGAPSPNAVRMTISRARERILTALEDRNRPDGSASRSPSG